ncbi:MAG TPA: hypothetical protein VIY86_11260, partial [Pirellulaceae bacterium]
GSDHGIRLSHETVGSVWYCPLFVDLNPKRSRREATWRHLTVAEALQPVPRDRAAGYRVRVGKDQWVFYRSFTRFGNRTLLGINTSAEFHCAQLLADSAFRTLLEVEISDD